MPIGTIGQQTIGDIGQFLGDTFSLDPGQPPQWCWWKISISNDTQAGLLTPLPIEGTIQYGPFATTFDADGTTYWVVVTNTTDQPVSFQLALFLFGIHGGNV